MPVVECGHISGMMTSEGTSTPCGALRKTHDIGSAATTRGMRRVPPRARHVDTDQFSSESARVEPDRQIAVVLQAFLNSSAEKSKAIARFGESGVPAMPKHPLWGDRCPLKSRFTAAKLRPYRAIYRRSRRRTTKRISVFAATIGQLCDWYARQGRASSRPHQKIAFTQFETGRESSSYWRVLRWPPRPAARDWPGALEANLLDRALIRGLLVLR